MGFNTPPSPGTPNLEKVNNAITDIHSLGALCDEYEVSSQHDVLVVLIQTLIQAIGKLLMDSSTNLAIGVLIRIPGREIPVSLLAFHHEVYGYGVRLLIGAIASTETTIQTQQTGYTKIEEKLFELLEIKHGDQQIDPPLFPTVELITPGNNEQQDY